VRIVSGGGGRKAWFLLAALTLLAVPNLAWAQPYETPEILIRPRLAGDRILAVRDEPISTLASFWRRVWASGPAGSEVVLQVVRDTETMKVRIPSADRTRLLKAPRLH
jgi:S1-C subfamily serine protease